MTGKKEKPFDESYLNYLIFCLMYRFPKSTSDGIGSKTIQDTIPCTCVFGSKCISIEGVEFFMAVISFLHLLIPELCRQNICNGGHDEMGARNRLITS